VYCGFNIVNLASVDDVVYFAAVKEGVPHTENKFFYSPIFKMNRIGKNGKEIKVYKLRTMYPYAEYLQDYIVKLNGYSKIGKPANDFRLPVWGNIFRKYWIDEVPQLLNVFKGEMRLVGARPLSKKVYNDYPTDIKALRNKYKPGCIPPYVSLMMQSMEKSIEAERIYLKDKEIHPITTDFKYFFNAIYNILSRKIRSS
jgi:lipopolysaccharide/colanic/teichoic acid biosynthesis glycosyltransferase